MLVLDLSMKERMKLPRYKAASRRQYTHTEPILLPLRRLTKPFSLSEGAQRLAKVRISDRFTANLAAAAPPVHPRFPPPDS